jgi:hypothetical protein
MNSKRMKQKTLAVLAIVFLVVLPALLLVAPASAAGTYGGQPSGTISAKFVSATYDADNDVWTVTDLGNTLTLPASAVGTQVCVMLKVTNPTNLWSLKTDLSWNNAVLHIAATNPVLGSGSPVASGNGFTRVASFLTSGSSTTFLGSDANLFKVSGTTGYINGGISETRMDSTATTQTGAAKIWCTVWFDVVASGTCTISLSNAIVKSSNDVLATGTTNNADLTVQGAFVAPEYTLGALAALAVAFAAFIGFAAVKKGVSIPIFSKRVA